MPISDRTAVAVLDCAFADATRARAIAADLDNPDGGLSRARGVLSLLHQHWGVLERLGDLLTTNDVEAAWAAVHEALPARWRVGQPSRDVRTGEWTVTAFTRVALSAEGARPGVRVVRVITRHDDRAMAESGATLQPLVMAREIAVMPALRRMRFMLRQNQESAPEVESPQQTTVEFLAYAEDCVLSGSLVLEADRLTDLLDEHDELHLVDVHARGLGGEPGIDVPELVVKRDDLLLVQASGPRGDRGRRRMTRQHHVAVQVGPYRVRGYVHALPGSDPITSFHRRGPMVPLTDAWIEYDCGGFLQREAVGGVIVNRALVDSIAEVVADELEPPELPPPVDVDGSLVRDFTGELRAD